MLFTTRESRVPQRAKPESDAAIVFKITRD